MGVLDGISPWWWVALAILLAAAEMVTITTVLVWSALAALLHRARCSGWRRGSAGYEQIGIFAALSIVFFFVGRALVGRFGQPGGDEAGELNRARRRSSSGARGWCRPSRATRAR